MTQWTNRWADLRSGCGRWLRGASLAALSVAGMLATGAAWADSLALMSGAGQQGLGGSTSAQPLVVAIRDANGAPVSGRTVNWSTSNGFVLSSPSSVTDANGLASVNFTYGNYGTTAIVAADMVAGNSAQADETSVGTDSITLISGNGQAGKSGSAAAQPIVVQLLDASGHPIVGRTVDWADKSPFTHVNAATSVTDAGGNASMGFTYVGGAVSASGNTGNIQATNSAAPSQFVLASETVVGFDNLTLLSGATQSGLIGSTSAPIVAQVTDDNGNPVAGVTVTWGQTSGTAGGVSLSSTSTPTDASGKASITFQYVLSTSGTITAQTPVTSSQDAHFASVSAASLTLISPSGMSGAPGSTSPSPVVVEAHKADGTLATGTTINWAVTSGDATVNAPTSVTDGAGRASMGFRFGTANSALSVSDNADGTSITGIPLLSVAPNGSLQLVSGQNQTGTVGGVGAPIVVRLLNQRGAPLVGHTISWNIASGNSLSLNAATSVTDATGQASVGFSYVQAGSGIVVASTDLVPAENQQVFVTETATGLYAVSAASNTQPSGIAGTHSTQPLVFQELDPAGNPVAGRVINWSSSGPATVDNPTSTTNANGQAIMGYTFGSTASTSQITASDPLTVATAGAAHFTVITVGSSALTMISGNGDTGAPGASDGGKPLVVEVRDASGKLVSGRTIHWTRLSGDSRLQGPSSPTDASGRATMDFTYGPSSATTSIFAATDPVSGEQVQFSVTTTVVQNHLVFVSGNGQSGFAGGASPQPIVVALLDANNQPVPGQDVTWSVLSGPATLTSETTTTSNPGGQVQASFNFGPTPGATIVQVATTGPNPLLVQGTITTLGNTAQTLTVVSGNGQSLQGANPSQPLVVKLTNAGNAPVVGATITWTTNHGTLQFATTTTDNSGQSHNVVTAANYTNAVTVQASAPNASAPAVFNLNAGLSDIPGLTPPEKAIAGSLDEACPALEALTNPTPAQRDLLARCQDLYNAGGIDPGATATALGQLVTETAEVQSDAAVNAATAQFQNITLRLDALRSSSKSDSLASGVSLSGLSVAAPGGAIPVGSLLDSLFHAAAASDDKKEAGAGFSRWGFFATGTIGSGGIDARSNTPAYHYDINGLTAGIDYRQRDNWISGVAVGYSRQNTNLQDDTGHVRMTGWSLSTYSTLSFHNNLYLDGVLTWGSNSFDLTRQIDYTLPTLSGGTTSIDQVATGRPGGNLFMAAVTFGGDFHKQAWNFSPYAQLISSHMGFDSYSETLLSGPGNGLGLAVDSRNLSTFSSVLGGKVSYTRSTSWGVFIPTASLEWQHEFNGDMNAITARFINDPTHTPFTLLGNTLENSFVRMGLGASFVLSQGRSGFVLYEHTFGQDGLHQDNLGVGIRIEF